MKRSFLLFICLAFSITLLYAQEKITKAYAITSEKQGNNIWTEVKLIDVRSGRVLKNIYENSKAVYNVFEARTGKQITVKDDRGNVTDHQKLPFAGYAAACAYDRKHNRLYFTPMYINELRYIDLNAKEPKMYYFQNESFSRVNDLNNEANHITRMVIGADGNGYALNNDGTHLVQFTTGKKPVINDLGSIQDDPANGQISIRNRCTSWGGDLIAAASGDLYLISANRSVFRIDAGNRKATYLGAIEGLPANFTTNGAVVDEDGLIVVSSANSVSGYYTVDPTNWKATALTKEGQVFNTSDLANGNLAFEKELKNTTPLISRSIVANSKIAVYPNPVAEGMFRVSFDNRDFGKYQIQLVDITGKVLLQRSVQIGMKGQVEEMEFTNTITKGVYMVKVVNNNKKTIYADKIFVQ
ncbi:MAG TPA: T9SS type A sorting domain-containing protein [Flavitalea sp.]|nr:T9SS type A sorting domain-containing protein [Flavitalea sp.]